MSKSTGQINDNRRKRVPLKGVLSIVGGFVVHLTLGTQLTYGNTNPYLVSYIRNASYPEDLEYIDGIWIQACMLMGMGASMFLGGVMEVTLGPRLATLLGAWFLSAGVMLTYFSIQSSFVASVFTYGVMFGLGSGASYAVPVGVAMRWFPDYRSFVGGAIFTGFGVGSVIFNQIITFLINPDNLSPDLLGSDGRLYFSQPEVLDRVPRLFLILGGTYLVMQLVACVLISDPPSTIQDCMETVQPTKITCTKDNVWSITKPSTLKGGTIYGATKNHEGHADLENIPDLEKNTDLEKRDSEREKENEVNTDCVDNDDLGNESVAIRSDRDLDNDDTEGNPDLNTNDDLQEKNDVLQEKVVDLQKRIETTALSLETNETEVNTNLHDDLRKNNDLENVKESATCDLEKETEVDLDVPPLVMLKSRMFYCIWFLFLLGGLGGVFLASQYKAYGQTFIHDDHFFAVVGSCAAAFNAVSGMFWGFMSDRYTFKKSIQMLLVIFSCVAYTLRMSESAGRAFFLIWICLVQLCLSGIYGIMPGAVGRIYGNKYIGINYGLVYTSQILTSAASAFVGQMLIDVIGYAGLFYIIGGSLSLALIIAISIQPTTPDGKLV